MEFNKMKFELVGFYPVTEKNFSKADRNLVGTVHLYCVDCKLDIRGIRVTNNGNTIFFNLPHVYGYDGDTGEKIRYPVIRFTDDEIQKEIFTFLKETCKTQALDNVKLLKPIRNAHKTPPPAPKNKIRPNIAGGIKKST